MENVLVVGGAGYVGGHLVDRLLEEGFKTTVYDNLTYENRYLKNVEFVFGDVRDYDKLKPLLKRFDVVVWLAARVGDGACKVNIDLTYSMNRDAVKWLVDNYNGKIIFSSTCSCYGINDSLIHEGSPANPLSEYADSKYQAEQYIGENYRNYLIYRLGTLYGVGDQLSRIRLDLVVNKLTMLATIGQKITINGGTQWRPLLHVRDAAEAIIFGIKKNIVGCFNLAENNYQIKTIAARIKDILPSTEVEQRDMPFEDLRNYRVLIDNIRKKGWKPLYELNSGIYQISNIFLQKRITNPNHPVYTNAGFLEGLNTHVK